MTCHDFSTCQVVILNADSDNPAPFAAFLDLQTFDNTEYDVRTPDEWLAIGMDNGMRKPVPGKALLPAKNPIYANCKLLELFASLFSRRKTDREKILNYFIDI